MRDDRETSREQVEMLKKWWHDYGRGILLAIIVGVLLGFGWQYWRKHENGQKQLASSAYAKLMQSQTTVNMKVAQNIRTKYSGTVYAKLAALLEAKHYVTKKQFNKAATALSWVVDHADSKAIQQVARNRLAQVQLQLGQAKQALKTLSTVSDSAFMPLILHLRARTYTALGKPKLAEKMQRQANKGLQKHGVHNIYVGQ